MESLLIALVLKYTTHDQLDLDKICADISAKKLNVTDAQSMVNYQNENNGAYEIQIEELCEVKK